MAEPGDPSDGPVYSSRAMATLMVVLVVGLNLLSSLHHLDVGKRELQDTDGYMRAFRVIDLLTGENGWFDGSVHWSNTPFGHSMHWTRPLDALLAALALPLAPFVGWRDAVYWAGLASGPLLHLALALTVAWAARPLMPRSATYLAGLVAGLQPVVLAYSTVGRVDHHVLIATLGVLAAGSTIRILVGAPAEAARFTAAPLGGLAAAGALWVSTESLLPIGLVVGALGVDWTVRGPGRARPAALWATWFAGATLAATLVERGPAHLFAIEYDRISLPHVVAAVVLAAGWWLVGAAPKPAVSSVARRLGIGASAALVALVGMRVAFPRILSGPFADVPDELRRVWLDHVSESQPMWDTDAPVTIVLFRLGAAFAAIAVAVVLVRRDRGSPRAVGWWFVAVWLVVTTVVSARSTRFALYPEAMAALPLAAGAWIAMERLAAGRTGIRAALVRVGLVGAAVLGYMVPVVVVAAVEQPAEREATPTCDLAELAPVIETIAADRSPGGAGAGAGRPASVLAHIDLGPELHARTGVDIVATPHHRDVDGILDARLIMRSEPDDARALLEERSVDMVLVCPERDREYLAPIPAGSLADLLLAGRPPSWLRAVPEGSDESDLYEVLP